MFKKILIFVLIVAMLSLASCRVVEVIDHSTKAPEVTTDPPKEYTPWGFWHSYEASSAIELIQGNDKAKLYSLTAGYYEYEEFKEISCTFDGNATFTLSVEDQTYTFTFEKYANTLTMEDMTYTHVEQAPQEHPKYDYPNFEELDSSACVDVGDIDYTSLATTILEGAPYDIAMEFYGSENKIPANDGITRPAQSGDFVNIDYTGKLDGVAFEGGTARNQLAFISDYKNGYIPSFTDGIIGHTVGETFDVDVTFPEDYHATDLAGKAVVFTMTLNSIYDLTLTDEQVAGYQANDYQTYAEWLDAAQFEVAKNLLYDVILDASGVIKLPEESYAYFYQQTIDYYHLVAYYYKINYEQLMLYYGLSESTVLQQARNQATYNLALYVLAEENELAWTEDDYTAKYEAYVANYLDAYPEASREEACEYADMFNTQIKYELTEEVVLKWAYSMIFPSEQK